MAKSISFSFGRFNPPTIGHEKLMDNSRRANRNYRIYASQTQDPKKNPLNFRSKVSIMKAMFPVHTRNISTDKVITAIDVMVNLYKEKYTDVVMVVGSDRVDEFDKLLNAYNGKKARHGYYKFKSIRVISAGERDPDAEGVSGMSASKMRKAAADNDYKTFQKGLPKKFKQGQVLFKTLQKEMGVRSLKEWLDEGQPNQQAKSLSDPKYRAKTEKDRKKELKKGKVKHKGSMYEKILTFKQAQEKDKKNQNKDPVGQYQEDITNEGFFDMFFPKQLAAGKKAVYKREYQAAAKMYQQFLKRGDKKGVALHKAASSFAHVSDRGLQQFVK